MPETLFRKRDLSVLLFCDNAALRTTLTRLVQRLDPAISVHDALPFIATSEQADLVIIAHGGAMDATTALAGVRACGADLPVLLLLQDGSVFPAHVFDDTIECMTLPLRETETAARLQYMIDALYARRSQQERLDMLIASMRDIGEERRIDTEEMLASFDRLVHFHDQATAAHGRRVGRYARVIADAARLSKDEIDLLEQVAPLHDIGKVGIAPALLNKHGRLDQQEMNVMREHAQMGYEILANGASSFLRTAAAVAHAHHERFDGAGYPQGLRGERIPVEARIVALADVYDALTSARPYKPAWSAEQACAFIAENRAAFDPELVDAFMRHGDEIRTLQTEQSAADN